MYAARVFVWRRSVLTEESDCTDRLSGVDGGSKETTL